MQAHKDRSPAVATEAEGVTGTMASGVDEAGVVAAVVVVVVEDEDMMMITTAAGVTIIIALRRREAAMRRIMVTRGDVEVVGTMIDMTALAVIILHLENLRADLRVTACLHPSLRSLVLSPLMTAWSKHEKFNSSLPP